MELAKKITATLNAPILGMNSVWLEHVIRLLKKLNISTMDELKAVYGDNWTNGFRTDYLDYEVWREKW